MTAPLGFSSESVDSGASSQGVTVKAGEDMARVQVSCPHQSGLIYAVPGDRSWVCSDELRPAHAMAGFFRELVALKDPRVENLMHEWGLYYRSLPLEEDSGGDESSAS